VTSTGGFDVLRVRAVSKRFGARPVLGDVGFEIRRREVLGLIGPNGAGKTTLLECLAGMLPAEGGDVSADGRSLSAAGRRRMLFYVPDGIAPWDGQRVGAVLGFFGDLHRRGGEEIRSWVAALGLGSLLGSRVGALSKGERKRFLLLLGLIASAPALLLDEPFDGLDLRQTRGVAGLLRSAAREGRALVLSIHQLSEAASVCDRLVLLDAGRVAGEGDLEALRERAGMVGATLEEVFLALT